MEIHGVQSESATYAILVVCVGYQTVKVTLKKAQDHRLPGSGSGVFLREAITRKQICSEFWLFLSTLEIVCLL